VWSEEKDEQLKRRRDVSFDAIIAEIEAGNLIDVIPSTDPEQPDGWMYVVLFRGYLWVVPFHATEDKIVLHTIFPSRKLMKHYGYR
jgi:hypothetical protein